jgi:RNA polymerase sigma-70 factor (ECF subfamily)
LQAEVTAVLDEAIQHDLTDKQRMVFKLIVFEQVPMDAIVQRLGTNRNAVYETMHNARKKLKRALQAHGFQLDEIFRIFGK